MTARRGPDQRLSVFDLVEAFQLGHAVAALHDIGLLASLQRRPATVRALAREARVDPNLLGGLLEIAAARTDLLRKRRGRFATTDSYGRSARFLLDMYTGAYGQTAARLTTLLRRPSRAPGTVDRRRHARAFETADAFLVGPLPAMIVQLGMGHLLDLGCGTGALLIEIAARDAGFVGWGLEFNPTLCRVARQRIRAAGVDGRVRVLVGDCTKLREALPAAVVAAVRTVTMGDVANEMFAGGAARFTTWLRDLRALLPGRCLLISDYYSRLGRVGRPRRATDRETLLHDFAQIISGQGLPPATQREWWAIYKRAGCRLVHVLEDRATTRFIHLLML